MLRVENSNGDSADIQNRLDIPLKNGDKRNVAPRDSGVILSHPKFYFSTTAGYLLIAALLFLFGQRQRRPQEDTLEL
jgi:hypothetical protein